MIEIKIETTNASLELAQNAKLLNPTTRSHDEDCCASDATLLLKPPYSSDWFASGLMPPHGAIVTLLAIIFLSIVPYMKMSMGAIAGKKA